MTKNIGPLPGNVNSEVISSMVLPPLVGSISGEITVGAGGIVLGSPRKAGRVGNVFLSLGASGRDDTVNELSCEVDVMINGTSCLTTAPKISAPSGEASQQKTTQITGDTGITQCLVDPDNSAFNAGDTITCTFTVVRTATPTTEMANPVVVVELIPSV